MHVSIAKPTITQIITSENRSTSLFAQIVEHRLDSWAIISEKPRSIKIFQGGGLICYSKWHAWSWTQVIFPDIYRNFV